MTDDFDIDLRTILIQVIEAREDRNDADRRLQEYRATHTPPARPDEFEGVEALLDYHHRRQGYEDPLRQRERALKRAKKEYAEAAAQFKQSLEYDSGENNWPAYLGKGSSLLKLGKVNDAIKEGRAD